MLSCTQSNIFTHVYLAPTHSFIFSSVVLVRKSSQTWQAINLAVMFTGQYYSQLIDGDGDVFRLAWLALGVPFHVVTQHPSLVGTFKV